MLSFDLSDEQKALVETAKRFSRERIAPIAAECDRESRFPRDVFVAAHELGLVNATVPPEYGGSGFPELDNALIAEQLAWGCTGIQTSLLANTPRHADGRAAVRQLLHDRADWRQRRRWAAHHLQSGGRRLRAERRKVLDHQC
jgi:alkylation response protein AidB-like acyl-CoA dehydrogenase